MFPIAWWQLQLLSPVWLHLGGCPPQAHETSKCHQKALHGVRLHKLHAIRAGFLNWPSLGLMFLGNFISLNSSTSFKRAQTPSPPHCVKHFTSSQTSPSLWLSSVTAPLHHIDTQEPHRVVLALSKPPRYRLSYTIWKVGLEAAEVLAAFYVSSFLLLAIIDLDVHIPFNVPSEAKHLPELSRPVQHVPCPDCFLKLESPILYDAPPVLGYPHGILLVVGTACGIVHMGPVLQGLGFLLPFFTEPHRCFPFRR